MIPVVTDIDAMKRRKIAAAVLASCCLRLASAELPRDIVTIDYSKGRGLVAAAYQNGQVVLWDFASGAVKSVFNASGEKPGRNKPIVRFSPDGRRIAFTAHGEAGLIVHDLDQGSSTVIVPRRMLYMGIAAVSWSMQNDAVLVAIGRDIALIGVTGQMQ